MQDGEFTEVDLDYSVPQPGIGARHPDAIGVYAAYRNAQGDDVAHVHYYRLPDGSIIPGKRPDPKRLLVDGVLCHQNKRQKGWRRAWFVLRDAPCQLFDAMMGI